MSELYENLSPELREKLKDCKTEAEMQALLAQAGAELDDEALDGVAGGWCGRYGSNCRKDEPTWTGIA